MPPQKSPGAAYQEAMRPVEITRRSIANWSQIEQASLGIAIRGASVACAARSYKSYSGNDLADYVRLCALGQGWPVVLQAAEGYLSDKANEERVAEIYGEKIDAELHLKQEPEALRDAKAMLGAVPYGRAVAEASDEALNYMEVLYTADAVSLAALREGSVLRALHEALGVPVAGTVGGSTSRQSVVDLYRQGLRLAVLQQFNGNVEDARQSVAALDDAVGSEIVRDDRIGIAAMQQEYAQLGQPLGVLRPKLSLDVSRRLPDIPANRAVTVLLLFPDWCAQCSRIAREMPESVFTVEKHEAYSYGLLVQTVPAQSPPNQASAGQQRSDEFNPALAASYLKGTPTVVVDSQVLSRFNAVDVPILIVTDRDGVVRFIGTADENAFKAGQTVDSLVSVIGRRWPRVNTSQVTSLPKAR